MIPVPTDIDAIGQMPSTPVRNLLITQRYHDLSGGLCETLGGPTNVNWSTFATWASKTAGLSIRNEEVPPVVNEIAGVRSILVAPVRETLGTVSDSISDGNRKVYAELAPLFAKFITLFRDTAGAGQKELDAFVDGLDPRPSEQGGQEPLRTAFTAYARARLEGDATVRARWMLLGNCLIGLHEQTRLQPQIQEAMDAPITDIVLKHLPHGKGLVGEVLTAVERPVVEVAGYVRDLWERVATRTMMSLSLPGGKTLPLGDDIRPEHARRGFLPAPLRDIDAPSEVAAMLAQFDRAHGDTDKGSRSVDWRVLDDRMNFIVNLFRSRQQDETLLEPPFSAAQREAIEARRMPDPLHGKL